MRFRSILLLGVSSVALQHASAQTAGVNGVPGSNVILPRQIPVNRPVYVLPGGVDRPYVSTPTVATPIYTTPSPFGPYGQLPLVTGGLPGYNAPLIQAPIPQPTSTGMPVIGVNPLFGTSPAFGVSPAFGANAPIVGQSLSTDFAKSPSSK